MVSYSFVKLPIMDIDFWDLKFILITSILLYIMQTHLVTLARFSAISVNK